MLRRDTPIGRHCPPGLIPPTVDVVAALSRRDVDSDQYPALVACVSGVDGEQAVITIAVVEPVSVPKE